MNKTAALLGTVVTDSLRFETRMTGLPPKQGTLAGRAGL